MRFRLTIAACLMSIKRSDRSPSCWSSLFGTLVGAFRPRYRIAPVRHLLDRALVAGNDLTMKRLVAFLENEELAVRNEAGRALAELAVKAPKLILALETKEPFHLSMKQEPGEPGRISIPNRKASRPDCRGHR